MSKKKLAVIIIFDILLIIALVIFAIKMYEKNKYSLEYVEELLSKANINENNVYYKQEFITEPANENTGYSVNEVYYKDKKTYYKIGPESNEFRQEWVDYPEDLIRLEISHFTKSISKIPITEDQIIPVFSFAKNNFEREKELHSSYENLGNYKYHGKEKLEGKKYIKISFTDYYKDQTDRIYYYIDIENNIITKTEEWTGNDVKNFKKMRTTLYTYESGSVTEDDFLVFDRNNYPDYTYSEYNPETGLMEEK